MPQLQNKTKMVTQKYEPIREYIIESWKFWIITILFKLLIFIGLATLISYKILYQQCMFNQAGCNPITTIFFAILALAFLEAAGIPTSKFIRNLRVK